MQYHRFICDHWSPKMPEIFLKSEYFQNQNFILIIPFLNFRSHPQSSILNTWGSVIKINPKMIWFASTGAALLAGRSFPNSSRHFSRQVFLRFFSVSYSIVWAAPGASYHSIFKKQHHSNIQEAPSLKYLRGSITQIFKKQHHSSIQEETSLKYFRSNITQIFKKHHHSNI